MGRKSKKSEPTVEDKVETVLNNNPAEDTVAAPPEDKVEPELELASLEPELELASLEPELGVEKVISAEDTKVYNFKADVFILDNENQPSRRTQFEGCCVEYNNPVPVIGDGGKVIGSVVLSLEGKTLVGDFFIDYATPERLTLENKEIPLFPHLDSHTDVVVSHGGIFVGTNMRVNSIILTMYPTLDPRIVSI